MPGKLVNPMNGSFSRAHWIRKSQWSNEWKKRTVARFLATPGELYYAMRLRVPKHITFLAQVGAQWDDDNLPAAIKPIRDALIGYVIHSDAPDSGHRFTYEQRVDRKQRGVRIRIEAL